MRPYACGSAEQVGTELRRSWCRVISLMMVTQYFDTLRDLGAHGRANTLFIPHQPGAIGDITDQIRNGFLQATQPQEMKRA